MPAPINNISPNEAEKLASIIGVLRKHGGKHGSIFVASAAGDVEGVKEFLAAGADVNAKIKWRNKASSLGTEIGAAPYPRGVKDDFTPLHFAALEAHIAVAALLITKGATVNAKDDNGKTPLDAAKGGYLTIGQGKKADARKGVADDRVTQTGPVHSLVWTG